MSTQPFDETQHPRDNTGKFAEKPQPAPDVGRIGFDTTGWQPDNRFPFPQANDLDKVACVADAVDTGADTPGGIAEVFEMVDREGAYYADAAGWLGLVEVDPYSPQRTYVLTDAGTQFVGLSDQERAHALAHMLMQSDDLDEAITNPEALQRRLGYRYADSTISRRIDTMRRWATQITDPGRFAHQIGQSGSQAVARFAAACERSQADRKPAVRPSLQHGRVCPTCFIQMPLSGVCDTCD